MAHFDFVCDLIVLLKWRQYWWWGLRPRTRWFVGPRARWTAAFCWASDRTGVRLATSSRTWHFSLTSTDHRVRGLYWESILLRAIADNDASLFDYVRVCMECVCARARAKTHARLGMRVNVFCVWILMVGGWGVAGCEREFKSEWTNEQCFSHIGVVN